MNDEKIYKIACKEAVEIWYDLSRETEDFNKDLTGEILGNIGISIPSFGSMAPIRINQTKKQINSHITNLDKKLRKFIERVERCMSLDSISKDIQNQKIRLLLLSEIENEIYNKNNYITCGYFENNQKDSKSNLDISLTSASLSVPLLGAGISVKDFIDRYNKTQIYRCDIYEFAIHLISNKDSIYDISNRVKLV